MRVRAPFRPDIQALRTIAVVLVVLYHLWPRKITGGFIGVDVFFVISGFLITSHIIRDVTAQRFSVIQFWSRRVRRLLPASLTVLISTALGIIFLVPQSLWVEWLSEVISSVFYFQNWVLAANSVNYLSMGSSASPTVHFWSLGVEEQFYIVWPMAIGLVVFLFRKRNAEFKRRAVFLCLSLLTATSLVFGIYTTDTDASIAYFSTPARAWEFGVGALISFMPSIRHKVWQPILTVVGLSTIIASGCLYNSSLPFPGTAALVPVFATALVIASNLDKGLVSRLLAFRPVQWLGDHSYSIYLWHWPVIILAPYFWHVESLSTLKKIAVLALTLFLSAISVALIERPLMQGGLKPNLRPRAVFGILLLLSTSITTGLWITIEHTRKPIEENVIHANSIALSLPKCFGAQAMEPTSSICLNNDLKGLYPSLAAASTDVGMDQKVCPLLDRNEWRIRDCTLTFKDAKIHIALVGDSHTGQYEEAMVRLAKLHRWNLDIFAKSRCPFSNATRDSDDQWTASCSKWLPEVKRLLFEGHYDLIVTSQASGVKWVTKASESQEQAAESGLVSIWSESVKAGSSVLAIKDSPKPVPNVIRCLELGSVSGCSTHPATSFAFDPQIEAVHQIRNPKVTLANLDKYFCDAKLCKPVIGHVVVFRDFNHLTNTFAVTLSPYLEEYITAALKQRSKTQ